MHYFKTTELYFHSLVDSFDILVISEHCPFEEQLETLTSKCNSNNNCIAVSCNENAPILSGKVVHGGIALLWKISLDNYVSPLDNIDPDHIMGIQCEFLGYDTLYILGVYLPSSSRNTEVYDEYFDYMWALYESLSSKGVALVMGGFNGDLGNSLGYKGKHVPNLCGLKLLDFANYFNLCPVNLMKMSTGLLETFNSYCGRFHSTLDYIFLKNCLLSSIKLARTFDDDVDNTSDNLPIQLKLRYTVNDSVLTCDEGSKDSRPKLKYTGQSFHTKQ